MPSPPLSVTVICHDRSDWYAWGFNGLLGATNGHLAALTLMHAPSLVDEGLRCERKPLVDMNNRNGVLREASSVKALAQIVVRYPNEDWHVCIITPASLCIGTHPAHCLHLIRQRITSGSASSIDMPSL